jgi:hypothetical protein
VVNSAQSTLTPSHVEPARIRQVLEEVLRRPDHEAAQPGPLQRALVWVLDAISRLIELLGQGDRGAIVGTVLLIVTVGATVLIIAFLLRRIRRDRGADSPHAGIAGRTAQDWRDRAHQAEAA